MKRGVRWIATGLAIVATAGGCRAQLLSSGEGEATAHASAPVGHAGLPTVVPFTERYPDLFDENGCLILGPSPSETDCGLAPAMPGEQEGSPAPEAWKHLLGFYGPFYLAAPDGLGVVLLEDTVTVGSGSTWSAMGLIRNESLTSVGVTTIHARLLDEAGMELAVAAAASPLDPIRPGEPAPFALASSVPASDVSRVEWSVEHREPSAGDGVRAVEMSVFWDQPYGERERIDFVYPPDPSAPPYPYMLAGGATSSTSSAIARPVVIFAWLDVDGRIAYVGSTPIRQFTLTAEGLDSLEPGAVSGFAIQVSDSAVGPMMSDGEGAIMLWASGE